MGDDTTLSYAARLRLEQQKLEAALQAAQSGLNRLKAQTEFQQRIAERSDEIEELKARISEAADRARKNPADHLVAEVMRLKKQLRAMIPKPPTADDEPENEEPRPRICPTDGVALNAQGECPVDRRHKVSVDPFEGHAAAKKRLVHTSWWER